MTIITRVMGSLTASAMFLLVILDILQKHLGVDTQALLLGLGGNIGNMIAGLSALFSEGITSIANWLAELTNSTPSCDPNCEAPPDEGLNVSSVTRSLRGAEPNFEILVQSIVGIGALLAAYFMLRRQN